MTSLLRLTSLAVVVAALALSGWSFWQWHTLLDGGVIMNPFRFDSVFKPTWASALPSVIPLLANTAGVALALLARASLRERAVAAYHPQAGWPVGSVPSMGSPTQLARIWHRLASASVLKSMAAALIVCGVIPLLLALVAPPLGWKTIVGVAIMIEPIDVFGAVTPGNPFAFFRNTNLVMGVLVLISILIVVSLYATARSTDRLQAAQPGSAEDRR